MAPSSCPAQGFRWLTPSSKGAGPGSELQVRVGLPDLAEGGSNRAGGGIGTAEAARTLAARVWDARPCNPPGTDVIDKLGFLVRFWELRARHATLGEPLTSPEQLELLSLMQLVTSELRMPSPGSCARPSNAITAQLIGEGRIVPVEVRHVCAAALLVACAAPITPRELVIIRTADAVSGVEYVLPCAVDWAFGTSPCIVALVVDGIPTRSELVSLADPRPSNVFAMKRQARFVG